MNRWIVKTEPSAYSFSDLLRDGQTSWDGVRNAQAQLHLRAMQRGDRVLVYHTGTEKAVVGEAHVSRGPYPDPADATGKRVAVELRPDRELRDPVSLASIKASRSLSNLALVRHGRLSVMPCSAAEWDALLALK